MKINSDKYSIFQSTDPKYATSILKLIGKLLLTPQTYQTSNDKKLERYENKGFLIGSHNVETLKKWIESSNNKIFLVRKKNTKSEQEDIVGNILILGDPDIIKKVQNYAKDITFLDKNARDVIKKGNFLYLIQIGVSKLEQNEGIGSFLFQNAFDCISKNIISFVIKSPLLNLPSLYSHLKNGFSHFGDYTGDYDKFPNYRSAGLIHYKNEKNPTLDILKNRFKSIKDDV